MIHRLAKLTLMFLSSFITYSYVYALNLGFDPTCLRPVVGANLGIALSNDVGASQNFPARIPLSYQFFNYTRNNRIQSAALYGGFLGIELNFQPDWAFQLLLDYNQATSYLAKGSLLQGVDRASAASYAYRYRILVRQLLLEGKLLATIKNCLHPYFLLGIGEGFTKAYNYTTNVPPFLAFTRLYRNNDATSFSYAIGLGVDVDLAAHWRLGLGYRFADYGTVQLGNGVIDTTKVNNSLTQSHFFVNEFISQLTFII